jgi:magnesium transporter
MLKCYLTVGEELTVIENLREKGAWISLVNPTEDELQIVSSKLKVAPDLLQAALDAEERSRLEVDDGQLLVLINVPMAAEDSQSLFYDAIPLGIIVVETGIITVCLRENPILSEFETSRPRTFYTFKRTRFVLQLLFKTATYYLRYLQQIDKKSNEIENQLHKSMKNEELIRLLNLEKSLVYFTTSLRANEVVMLKLMRSHLKAPSSKKGFSEEMDQDTTLTSRILKMYPEDEELLEDVITENKQAIEMSETYSNILSGMMDAFASIISNNLNMVMKFLTSVTIIVALPTMVSSFFGMNVDLPFQKSPWAFLMIVVMALVFCLGGVLLLRRKSMF